MKKILICLLFSSLSAHAEWSLLTTTEKRDLFYVDFDTVRYGKTSSAWFMMDFGKRTAEDAMSAKFMIEANCKGRKTRLLSQLLYSANGGRGSKLRSDTSPTEWESPQSNTPNEAMFKFLCHER